MDEDHMTKDNTELKPCPFCGYSIFEDHDEETSADAEAICCVYDGEDESHYFECPRCEAQGPKADCTEDAAEGWNTRHTPTDGLAGELEAALLEIESVLQATPERGDFADDLAQQQDQALIDIHEISQKVLKSCRDADAILTALQGRTYADGVEDAAKAWAKRTGTVVSSGGRELPYLKIYFETADDAHEFDAAIRALKDKSNG